MKPPLWPGQEHRLYEEKPRAMLAQTTEADPSEKPLSLCPPSGTGCKAQPYIHCLGYSAHPGQGANAGGQQNGRNYWQKLPPQPLANDLS